MRNTRSYGQHCTNEVWLYACLVQGERKWAERWRKRLSENAWRWLLLEFCVCWELICWIYLASNHPFQNNVGWYFFLTGFQSREGDLYGVSWILFFSIFLKFLSGWKGVSVIPFHWLAADSTWGRKMRELLQQGDACFLHILCFVWIHYFLFVCDALFLDWSLHFAV